MRASRAIPAAMLVLAAAVPMLGQDLVAVAPQQAKVEYEDARVRVVRLRLAANASLPMHDRPARVVIPLTANDVLIRRSGETDVTVHADAGKAAWSGPGKRSVTNLSVPLENIVVELKQAAGLAKPLTQPPTPRPAHYLEERFHHWVFENQYVRVYDVLIPPGATTDFHVHGFDSVFVLVSGGLVATQAEGQEWAKAERITAGSVDSTKDAGQPRTHRVRNDGPTEFHVIVVQLLP